MNEFQLLILQIFGTAAIVTLLQHTPLYQKILQEAKLEFKPFNCTLCIGFWVSIPLFVYHYGWEGIYYGCITAIVAELFDKNLLS